jgi:hypothetical protein
MNILKRRKNADAITTEAQNAALESALQLANKRAQLDAAATATNIEHAHGAARAADAFEQAQAGNTGGKFGAWLRDAWAVVGFNALHTLGVPASAAISAVLVYSLTALYALPVWLGAVTAGSVFVAIFGHVAAIKKSPTNIARIINMVCTGLWVALVAMFVVTAINMSAAGITAGNATNMEAALKAWKAAGFNADMFTVGRDAFKWCFPALIVTTAVAAVTMNPRQVLGANMKEAAFAVLGPTLFLFAALVSFQHINDLSQSIGYGDVASATTAILADAGFILAELAIIHALSNKAARGAKAFVDVAVWGVFAVVCWLLMFMGNYGSALHVYGASHKGATPSTYELSVGVSPAILALLLAVANVATGIVKSVNKGEQAAREEADAAEARTFEREAARRRLEREEADAKAERDRKQLEAYYAGEATKAAAAGAVPVPADGVFRADGHPAQRVSVATPTPARGAAGRTKSGGRKRA